MTVRAARVIVYCRAVALAAAVAAVLALQPLGPPRSLVFSAMAALCVMRTKSKA